MIIIIFFLPLFVCGQERIMLVSDPHVLANSLVEEGAALDTMMAGQRKMLDLSELAFVAIVDTALLHKPDLLLIPGDLTKDSEVASHNVVVSQMQRLQAAGINTLVIPGNHDIGGNAYAYRGAEKEVVDGLTDDEWESHYAMVYEQVIANDPNSHSYVAEPLPGVTILGIDASHNAGEGYLSNETLKWILAQSDSARAKGNMMIAMCHWQLLEHVDKGGVTMESGCLTNADVVRDSLMAHGVRLVLTGHMHINSISTYRDTLTMSGDSIVEISTGSPITYPCPYRWLTITPDRSSVEVQTENLVTLVDYPDLQNYSREWMREHAEVMIPALSIQLFEQAEILLDEYIKKNVPMVGNMISMLLKKYMPQTEKEKIDFVNKHLTPTIIELYLLHSDANEPNHPTADSLAQAMYAGVEAMIREVTDPALKSYAYIQQPMIDMVVESMKEPVQSLVEDRTYWASKYYSDVTDDLQVKLTINDAQSTRIEHICAQENMAMYDILGRRVDTQQSLRQGVYIQNGKKIIKK